MTVMKTEERQPRPARARTSIRRPSTGITIDPARLAWYREGRGLSRQELAARVTDNSARVLGEVLSWDPEDLREPDGSLLIQDRYGRTGRLGEVLAVLRMTGRELETRLAADYPDVRAEGLSRDSVAKIENGDRNPLPLTARALCAALSLPGDPVTPKDLLPGSTLPPHRSAAVRAARLSYNRNLRAFAIRHDIPLRHPETGRIYYSKELRDKYAAMVSGQDLGLLAS